MSPLPKQTLAILGTPLIICGLALFCLCGCDRQASRPTPTVDAAPAEKLVPATVFLDLVTEENSGALTAIERIKRSWKPDYLVLLLEAYHFTRNRQAQLEMEALFEQTTGLKFRGSDFAFYQWLWNRPETSHPDYVEFKRQLYQRFDPSFSEYFDDQPAGSIRADEIRWGGVQRDGIPPLKNPLMIPAAQATWLADDHVVFGVALNGDERAYPKRILAWHEMFKDKVGGLEVNGVYCTLCGSLILYDTTVAGRQYELGTSGFLYRSNKLMYDAETKSLWSTLEGEPVFGPLAGQGIRLQPLHVVTSTWGEWRKRHPETTVLSLETGHQRDYGEGVAYRTYFASEELMFPVPKDDARLPAKTEILALRNIEGSESLAITAKYLLGHPVLNESLGPQPLVVLTDPSGANRVYARRADHEFTAWDSSANTASDSSGANWTVSESGLSGPNGALLPRLSAHRAFWFAWAAQYPQTRLVKE